jgi:hypothetical protein
MSSTTNVWTLITADFGISGAYVTRLMDWAAAYRGYTKGVSAAYIHITRHLPLEDASLNDLAAMAAMSKQVMAIVNPQSLDKRA